MDPEKMAQNRSWYRGIIYIHLYAFIAVVIIMQKQIIVPQALSFQNIKTQIPKKEDSFLIIYKDWYFNQFCSNFI